MSVSWVAGGVGNLTAKICFSSDGINWTNSSNATSIFGYQVYAISHNGEIWVAGGATNNISGAVTIGYSSDGNTWSKSTSGNSILNGNVFGIAYGNGKFVAVGSGTNYSIMYSTDGINWTGCASNSFFGSSASCYGYCIIYKNNTWVAGGYGGTGSSALIGYSADGINWTLSSSTVLGTYVSSIDYNGTNWVAIGTGSSNQLAYSTNLTSWTATSGTFGGLGRSVKWDGSKFIAVGQTDTSVLTSTTGTSWSTATSTYFTSYKFAISWNNNQWIIGQGYSAGSNCILYSSNGVTWTPAANNVIGTDGNAAIKTIAYALPPPYYIGSAPTITNITTDNLSKLYVYFTPGTVGYPAVTTYYYSLNGGNTYTNANTTTSPITISGLEVSTNYNVALIANNAAGNTVASNIFAASIIYPCFLEGTKILRFNPDTYQEEYVAVQNLRRDDLLLTSESGYKAIHSIGYRTLFHPKNDPNPSNRLYKFTKRTCPTVFEPLYITGEHCTLHTHLTEEKLAEIKKHMGDVYITEESYRMPACIDDRAEQYDREDTPVIIWHFALENKNVAHNYGVYANGLLVESCAIESLLKKSGMNFL